MQQTREGVEILIYTPGVRGLRPLFRIWLQLFVAVLLSYGILWYVSIPAFMLVGVQFPRFVEYWSRYGYSRPVVYVSTAILLVLLFLTANCTRTFVAFVVKLVLRL